MHLAQEDIKNKPFYYSLDPENMGIMEDKPKSGSYLSNIQLQDLLFAKLARYVPFVFYLCGQTDGNFRNEHSEGGKAVELFSLIKVGYGEQSEDGIYTGDLIHRIFAKI